MLYVCLMFWIIVMAFVITEAAHNPTLCKAFGVSVLVFTCGALLVTLSFVAFIVGLSILLMCFGIGGFFSLLKRGQIMFEFLLPLTLILCTSVGTALALQKMTHNTDLTKDWLRGCLIFSLLCWVFSLSGFVVGVGICSLAVICFYLNEYRIWRNS